MKQSARFNKKILLTVAALLVMGINCSAGGFNEQPYNNYNYTYWGEVAEAPAAYLHKTSISLNRLYKEIKLPSDMAITPNGEIIICDSKANRIIGLSKSYEFLWELGTFDNAGATDSFNQPSSAFYKDGNLYVADTMNGRILKFDKERKLQKVYPKPKMVSVEDDQAQDKGDYQPVRIAVDRAGRLYVIAKNINQGFIVLDKEGMYKGYFGAPKVKPDMVQLIWRIFSTEAQNDKGTKFVPTEYNSVDIDGDDFIYCTSNTFNQSDMYSYTYSRSTGDQFAPVKKLNPAGADVMLRTGIFPPVGDLRVPNSPLPGSPILATILDRSKDAIMGFSSLVDVKVIDSGIYFVLDRKRNRIFSYDHEGNLLFLFGSFGSREASFGDPVSVDVYQDEVYVLNSQDATIDVFGPTDYGSALLQASRLYKNGKYTQAEDKWRKILNMNANLEQAYVMIGKIHMQDQDYKTAMNYFQNGNSKANYSKAFRLYRSGIIEDNFLLIIGVLVLAGILFAFFRKLLKKASALPGFAGKAVSSGGYSVYVCFHPFDGFYDLKHEKKGGLATAIIIFGLTAVTSVLESTYTAYIFNYNNPKYVNIPFIILTRLLPLIMFVIANWCLTTLMDGKGKFKDIFVFVCYAQLPVVLLNPPVILVSHFLTIEEGAFYTAVLSVSGIWSVLLLVIGTMVTHDYSVKKTVITLILTVIGILIIAFLCLFFMTIVESMWKFIEVLMYEITLL